MEIDNPKKDLKLAFELIEILKLKDDDLEFINQKLERLGLLKLLDQSLEKVEISKDNDTLEAIKQIINKLGKEKFKTIISRINQKSSIVNEIRNFLLDKIL
ncbi:MAG: hypothetical protein P8Y70_09755 [Candidatus Lokiarchaeota archaeon]